jgi:PAS domain S-box-containing protein
MNLELESEALPVTRPLLEQLARIGSWQWYLPHDHVMWSDQMYRLARMTPQPIDFQKYGALFHPDDLASTLNQIQAAVSSGEGYELQHRVILDGETRWWHCRGEVLKGSDGKPERVVGTVQDITELRFAQDEAALRREAEAGRLRSEFLARASRELASSLDYEQTLKNIARLAVPSFADYCVVDLVDEGLAPARLVTHHNDPAKSAYVTELSAKYPPNPDLPHGVHHVIRTRQTEYVRELPDGILVAAARDAEHLRLLRELKLCSYIVVPLIARERVFGAMTVVYAESDRRYELDDVVLIEDLAQRAAVAIDNARLVAELEEQRRTIEEQASELEMQSVELEAQTEELLAQQAELEDALARMTEQENRQRQILDSVRDMIFTKSYGSVVTYANKAACDYYGMSLEELRGITDVPFNKLDLTQQYIQDDLKVFETGVSVEQLEEPNVSRSGDTRYFHTVKTPIFNAEGKVIELVGVSRDVTDAARARKALEEANRAKSSFMAVMSHELRTPLNAMIGYADLLIQGLPVAIPDAALNSVERISLSARHLLEIIEEILTYSRIEAGRESLSIEEVPLNQVMEEVAAIALPLALKKNLQFTPAAVDGDIVIRTDARKLRQILLNLVGNAFKFTERGSVSVHADVTDDQIAVAVTDTGIGIADDNLQRIFEPFWQVESQKSRRANGTGLGLTVTARLAEMMGGRVDVSSEVGVGSTFTLRIPRL